MKYFVIAKLAERVITYDSDADIKVLWKAATSLIRWSKWHACAASFIVCDSSRNILFWVYSRKSGDTFKARLYRTGKYGRDNFEF